jgi:hypothetical protein
MSVMQQCLILFSEDDPLWVETCRIAQYCIPCGLKRVGLLRIVSLVVTFVELILLNGCQKFTE